MTRLLILGFCCAALAGPPAAAQPPQGDFDDLRNIEVGLSGSRMMHVELIRPRHSPFKPAPVVFILHSGGWLGSDYEGNFGRGNLVSKGFAVVNVEYHPAGENARWPVQLQDCLRAVRWMRAHAAQYQVDPRHFAAYGESAGAHLATCLAVYGDDPAFAGKENDPNVSAGVQAVVLGDAPLDILASEKDRTNPKYRWNIENLLGGTPEQKPEAWREACMTLHVSKGLPPFFIWHGDKDDVVPRAEAVHFVDALNRTGVPVEFITVKGGRHDAFTPADPAVPIEPDGKVVIDRMTAFLEKYLTP